jgi:hypothetical protein
VTPFWPFKKKPTKSRISRQKYVSNVVEYERKTDKEKRENKEESHLKDGKFLDAMKLLSKKD